VPREQTTYYTISDRNYFLGTVALLNSLALTGNPGSLFVLDTGLSPLQRELLSRSATLVDRSKDMRHPFLLKPYPHMLEPAGTVVVIDSDIIVTAPLTDIFESAASGLICAFPERPEIRSRWFPEWAERLELRAPLHREACINTGFVAFSVEHWPDLLRRWWDVCRLVREEEIWVPGPFQAPDQDAMNALLMSEIPRECLRVLPETEAGFGIDVGHQIEVTNFQALTCRQDGHELKTLHFLDRPKPWERSGWARLAAPDYVRLMRRVLFAEDVPLRIDPSLAPIWLRPGRVGETVLTALGLTNGVVVSLARHTPDGVKERLRRFRRTISLAAA
jgi:hypothetical protein